MGHLHTIFSPTVGSLYEPPAFTIGQLKRPTNTRRRHAWNWLSQLHHENFFLVITRFDHALLSNQLHSQGSLLTPPPHYVRTRRAGRREPWERGCFPTWNLQFRGKSPLLYHPCWKQIVSSQPLATKVVCPRPSAPGFTGFWRSLSFDLPSQPFWMKRWKNGCERDSRPCINTH